MACEIIVSKRDGELVGHDDWLIRSTRTPCIRTRVGRRHIMPVRRQPVQGAIGHAVDPRRRQYMMTRQPHHVGDRSRQNASRPLRGVFSMGCVDQKCVRGKPVIIESSSSCKMSSEVPSRVDADTPTP